MSYKEKDIVHENDTAFVLLEKERIYLNDLGHIQHVLGTFYGVYIKGDTIATSTEAYADLSVAIARADYLDKRKNEK